MNGLLQGEKRKNKQQKGRIKPEIIANYCMILLCIRTQEVTGEEDIHLISHKWSKEVGKQGREKLIFPLRIFMELHIAVLRIFSPPRKLYTFIRKKPHSNLSKQSKLSWVAPRKKQK